MNLPQTSETAPPLELFVLSYKGDGPYERGFAVYARESGEVARSSDLHAPGAHREVALRKEEALQLLRTLENKYGPPVRWKLGVAAAPCPQCGRDIWTNDGDFAYPTNRQFAHWRLSCNEHDGGCGFEIIEPAQSRDEALQAWNRLFASPAALERMWRENTFGRRRGKA